MWCISSNRSRMEYCQLCLTFYWPFFPTWWACAPIRSYEWSGCPCRCVNFNNILQADFLLHESVCCSFFLLTGCSWNNIGTTAAYKMFVKLTTGGSISHTFYRQFFVPESGFLYLLGFIFVFFGKMKKKIRDHSNNLWHFLAFFWPPPPRDILFNCSYCL
jgi:hypothetical protein